MNSVSAENIELGKKFENYILSKAAGQKSTIHYRIITFSVVFIYLTFASGLNN